MKWFFIFELIAWTLHLTKWSEPWNHIVHGNVLPSLKPTQQHAFWRLLTTCLPMFLRVAHRFYCACACFDLMTLNINRLKSQRKLPKNFPFNIAWIVLTMTFFTRFTIWLAFTDEKNKVLIMTNFVTDQITRLIAISTTVDRNIFGGNLNFIASSINIDQNVGKPGKKISQRKNK